LNFLFIASIRKGSKRAFDISGDDSAEVCLGAMQRPRHIRSICIKELAAEVDGEKITNYRINAKVTFDL
jgi:dodecin